MNFVLAAGGTGGHMVPAHALAAELRSRGHGVLLITDDRGARFPGLFDNVPVHILPAGRLGGGPIGWLKALRSVIAGRSEARGLYRNHRPNAVVGFGGYPAFPSLLAASALRIPTLLHEQNAVLGRVNRLLGERGGARSPPGYERGRAAEAAPSGQDGDWSAIRCASESRGWARCRSRAFDELAPLKILITGGSQGASVLG